MDNDPERWRTACHEVGHVVAAWALGFQLGPVTCVPGTRLVGCAFAMPVPVDRAEVDRLLAKIDNPYALFPPAIVERLNHTAIQLMAGLTAEELLSGPRPAPLVTGRVEELPELPGDETQFLAAAVDDVLSESDDDKIAKLARVAFGSDTGSAASWRLLMAEQARALLLRYEERLRWLAQILAEEGSLSAEAVTGLLADRP